MNIKINRVKGLIGCLLICPQLVLCQSSSLDNAINQGNAEAIIRCVVQNPLCENDAVDAFCTVVNIENFSYEEIMPLVDMCSNFSVLSKITGEVKAKRELEIYAELKNLSMEEIEKYKKDYPTRIPLVKCYIEQHIIGNLDSLSYLELVYLRNNMPELGDGEIKNAATARTDEKRQLMSDNVDDYVKSEFETSEQILYDIEKVIWKFFIEAHKQLTKAYSKIPLVPDDPNAAAKQYQELVKICFSSKQLQGMLQTEVDNYCKKINKSRGEYSRIANVKVYPEFNFKVPLLNYNSRCKNDMFNEIPKARKRYIDDRQTANSISGVTGFLFGGLWGLGVKALGDWASISSLVDNEYSIRLKYVDLVYNALYKSFVNYTLKTTEQFKKSLQENEKKYINTIKQ